MSFSAPISVYQGEGPYWIIISDEGAAYHPHQHSTYDEAYEESVRLAKIKPGVKFNIFKYSGHTIAEQPKVEHRTYREHYPIYQVAYGIGAPKLRYIPDEDVPF